MQNKTYTLIHVSDLHLLSLKGIQWQELINKRIYGLLSKTLANKGSVNYNQILDTLQGEISRIKPHWTVFSGDLTHLALFEEFQQGEKWLSGLSQYSRLIAVPGNHDSYLPQPAPPNPENWKFGTDCEPGIENKDTSNRFPFTIISPPVALIGLDTSLPTPTFCAYGRIGEAQLQELQSLLENLRDRDLFKILILHHPPGDKILPKRKRLLDSERLLSLLQSYPVQMVLHGHTHKQGVSCPDDARGLKSFGISSISALNKKGNKRSAINIFQIQSLNDFSWKVDLNVKKYSREAQNFVNTLHKEYIY